MKMDQEMPGAMTMHGTNTPEQTKRKAGKKK